MLSLVPLPRFPSISLHFAQELNVGTHTYVQMEHEVWKQDNHDLSEQTWCCRALIMATSLRNYVALSKLLIPSSLVNEMWVRSYSSLPRLGLRIR